MDYIYASLGIDLNHILTFAGIPENGREIDGKSELAHRTTLDSLLRIFGAVQTKKASRHFITRPTPSHSIVPKPWYILSPRHPSKPPSNDGTRKAGVNISGWLVWVYLICLGLQFLLIIF